MALNQTPVSRGLDRKLKILGFEVFDLIIIFLNLASLNFLLSGHPYQLILIFGPSLLLALLLRIMKKGKPDNYLIHFIKFHISPKYLSAFLKPKQKLKIKRNNNLNE